MYACQPAAAAPLAEAKRRGVPAAHVTVGQTEAYSRPLNRSSSESDRTLQRSRTRRAMFYRPQLRRPGGLYLHLQWIQEPHRRLPPN